MDAMPELLGLTMPSLAQHLDAIGVGRAHASKVFSTLHRHLRPLAEAKDLGRHVETIERTSRAPVLDLVEARRDEDGTEKLLFALHDGQRIEAVLVPMPLDRTTLCVSSQAGCAMACRFCATGTLGLGRNLSAGEILAQIHAARAWAARDGRSVHRLVFMGMGEPLHNWPAVRDALEILTDPHGVCFGTKQITVSTVGLPDRMRDLAEAFGGRLQLALSLHAGTDETRAKIIPLARKVPLETLRSLIASWPLPGTRALMVEYVVLPGVNDDEADLDGVARFMDGVRGVVNLIPFNPFPNAPFRSPTTEEAQRVQSELRRRGVFATVRWPRGRGSQGACGQLAAGVTR